MCDLGLTVHDTWLEDCVERLREELDDVGLRRFRVHTWLSDEWCSPDRVPGIGIPFYLAHPRLIRLERQMMFEVEGGTRLECMRLLRHEAGHALQHAYNLQRRKLWQRAFGRASDPYPDFYRPNPLSKGFVEHLDGWYAQAHPVEDFAETFAVWLAPRSNWRKQYATSRALDKLEYIDALVDDLSDRKPPVKFPGAPVLAAVPSPHAYDDTTSAGKTTTALASATNTIATFSKDLQRLPALSEQRNGGVVPEAKPPPDT